MPAEWEPHEATWIAWPHNVQDWPSKFEPIPHIYAEIVRYLAASEKVHIIVEDAAREWACRKILRDAAVPMGSVYFHRWPTDRVWTRDSGPLFVKDRRGRLVITNWKFNAWAKYKNWHRDDLVPDHVANALGLPDIAPAVHKRERLHRVVLEGGSIDVNGRGSMLTTEECLLSKVQQRNTGLTRRDLEKVFEQYLGVTHVIWLRKGIVGDDTHGHIDDIARFVDVRTIVTSIEPDRRRANYKPLRENLTRLERATDQNGKRLDVIELPLPAPVIYKGSPLPASYANFYVANKHVLVPIFGDPNDRIALNILQAVFPKREVVPIYCRDFIWGFGAVHCMTQQQPRMGR